MKKILIFVIFMSSLFAFSQKISLYENEIPYLLQIETAEEKALNEIYFVKKTKQVAILDLTQKISLVQIGENSENFEEYLKRYSKIENSPENSDLIIIAIFKEDKNELKKIEQFFDEKKIVLCIFVSPEIIKKYDFLKKADEILISEKKSDLHQNLVSQIVFGALKTYNKPDIAEKIGLSKNIFPPKSINRFSYLPPKFVGIDSAKLHKKIDSIAEFGISQNAYPGCQILLAKNGKVFFHKAYGHHTYDSIRTVELTDLYDIASATKITAPLPCLMKLTDEQKFDVNQKFSKYWRPFRRGNKKDITVKEVLAHQAGLTAWIPFWKIALRKNKKWKRRTFRTDSNKYYCIKVADSLYLHRKFYKKVYKKIKKSPLKDEKKYVYSDLSFYLYPKIIEKITKQNYETYLNQNFYAPLGATSVCYNPLQKYPASQIVPTENDRFFRKEQIHGRVHDEGAILLDGISGHAGLFANANDLAKIMQMYLNKGNYGNKQYISEKTLNEWTSYQFPENDNRRGLGFDKIDPKKRTSGTPSPDVSDASFGHTGFTGTFVWADPENGLLIVFLSNRVYPTRENKNLWRKNIRTNIHQTVYDLLIL